MKEGRFRFWRKWLIVANLMTVGIGIMAAFAGNVTLLRPWNTGIGQVFFQGEAPGPETLPLKNWLMGIIGGTIVGFHVLMTLIAWIPFAKKEKWSWYACWAGLLSWFCIDSSVSAYYGAWFNLYLINGVALIAIGLPLAMTWRAFK